MAPSLSRGAYMAKGRVSDDSVGTGQYSATHADQARAVADPLQVCCSLLNMTIRQIESWNETLTLHAHLRSQLRVQVSSVGGHVNEWTGTVDQLDLSGGHCFVDGHMVSFAWLIRLITPSGDVFENPNSMKVWRAAVARREEEKRTTERVRSEEWFVPSHTSDRVSEISEVPATYQGQSINAFCAVYEGGRRQILLRAKNRDLARRALDLTASGERFWAISGALLKGGVLWLPWHQMMSWCCHRAQELRKGMPPLAPDCTFEQEQERAAWYAANDLDPQDYACWPSAHVLESYSSVDWESLFHWADGRSAKVMADFMTKAWSSNEFLPADGGGDIDFETLQSLRSAGLVALEPVRHFSLRDLAGLVDIKELRAWVAEAGSPFKSRSSDSLRDHLIALAPPFLEDRLRKRTPARRLRMVTPAGWTWAEFQQVRKLYQMMAEDLQQYLFNGFTRKNAQSFLAYRRPSGQDVS